MFFWYGWVLWPLLLGGPSLSSQPRPPSRSCGEGGPPIAFGGGGGCIRVGSGILLQIPGGGSSRRGGGRGAGVSTGARPLLLCKRGPFSVKTPFVRSPGWSRHTGPRGLELTDSIYVTRPLGVMLAFCPCFVGISEVWGGGSSTNRSIFTHHRGWVVSLSPPSVVLTWLVARPRQKDLCSLGSEESTYIIDPSTPDWETPPHQTVTGQKDLCLCTFSFPNS